MLGLSYSKHPKVIGFHGTYAQHVANISQINFLESTNHDVWLGDGVYFFIEGIGFHTPEEYAKQWAIDQCYNTTTNQYTQKEYSVLQATVRVNPNKFLDLTELKGVRLFNEFREEVVKTIAAKKKVPTKNQYADVDILKLMRKKLGIEFVKCDLYIKFAAQRIYRIASIVPNVSVLVVNNPTENIIRASIKEIKKGAIP